MYRIPGEIVIYSCCSLSPPTSWTRVQENVGRVSTVGSLRQEFFWSELFQTIFVVEPKIGFWQVVSRVAAHHKGSFSFLLALIKKSSWVQGGVNRDIHSFMSSADWCLRVCWSLTDSEWVVWAGGSVPLNTWDPGHVSPGTLCPLCTAWCLHPPINLICYVHPVKSCRWHRHQWCWRISSPMTLQFKFPSCFDWLHFLALNERKAIISFYKKKGRGKRKYFNKNSSWNYSLLP